MVYANAWDDTTPPGAQAANLGDDRIREHKVNVRQRFEGVASPGLIDRSGTRTFDTDPFEINPGHVDTAALEAGAIGALTRAVTYFDLATDAASRVHAVPNNVWEVVTGLTVTIPGTVLMAAGIEHAAGAVLDSSDYVIYLIGIIRMTSTTAGGDSLFRIRNSTDGVTVSGGDANATGGASAQGAVNFTGAGTDHFVLIGRDTGRVAATTYRIEFGRTTDPGVPALTVNNDICRGELHAIVFKR